jgi:hypothetical protein
MIPKDVCPCCGYMNCCCQHENHACEVCGCYQCHCDSLAAADDLGIDLIEDEDLFPDDDDEDDLDESPFGDDGKAKGFTDGSPETPLGEQIEGE